MDTIITFFINKIKLFCAVMALLFAPRGDSGVVCIIPYRWQQACDYYTRSIVLCGISGNELIVPHPKTTRIDMVACCDGFDVFHPHVFVLQRVLAPQRIKLIFFRICRIVFRFKSVTWKLFTNTEFLFQHWN